MSLPAAPHMLVELKRAMEKWEEPCAPQIIPVHLDLIWEHNFTLEEIEALAPVVIVDANRTHRQIALQEVRGQIRYMLTTDRRQSSERWEDETGTLTTVDDAIALAHEFLVADVPILELKTPRLAVRPAGKRP